MIAPTWNDRFTALYHDHHRYVRGVLVNRVPASEVDDLAQEAFRRVWRSHDGREATEAETRRFVALVAVRVAAWYYQEEARADRRRRQGKVFSLTEGDTAVEPSQVLEHDDYERIDRELERMSVRHQQVLRLAIAGYSVPETAAQLGIGQGTVAGHLQTARRMLRKILGYNVERGVYYTKRGEGNA